jgi:chromosome segregation ATPase
LLDFLGKCELPKPCREMLQTAVPICLEVMPADRHKFQVEVLDKVGALLASVEAGKRGDISANEAELAEVTAEKETATADVNAKKATSDAEKSKCDEKGKVVDSVREVSNAAAKALKEAQGAQEAFDAKKAGLAAEQENFAKLLAEVFQPLKEGTLQGNWQKRNKQITELKKKLSELGAQDSLGDALTATLKMTPEKREGTFAKATMQFAEEYFNKHTAKVAQDIAGLDAEAASLQATTASAEGTVAEKKAALDAVEKEWDEMQDVWVAADKEAALAAKGLSQIENRIPRVNKNIDKAKDSLEKFLELPALYSKLKENSTAVPEEPEEEKKEAEEENAAGEGEKAEEMQE